jgi:glycosyltransferase involved in cell wall biosynthesis
MNKTTSISVIIPAFNYKDSLISVIDAINNQIVAPNQIVIVDSSNNNDIERMIDEYSGKVKIVYKKVSQAFPGEARNLGAEIASGKWLAFLDSKTIPNKSWLMDSFNEVSLNGVGVVFGLTHYIAKTNTQFIVKAAVYGDLGVETTPGTLISKENFIKIGGFTEKVRTADDLEWRNRVKKSNLTFKIPKKSNLKYSEISDSLYANIKRFFVYQLFTAKINVQTKIKGLYLSLFLLFSASIIPNWNSMVGWEGSIFYIPNITKVYLSLLAFMLFALVFFTEKARQTLIMPSRVAVLVIVTLVVINWNGVFAGWEEDGLLYMPHITKFYILFLSILSVLYRGIYFPLTHGIEKSYLFPLRWLYIGFFGLLLDIVKAPGYIIGAFIHLFRARY